MTHGSKTIGKKPKKRRESLSNGAVLMDTKLESKAKNRPKKLNTGKSPDGGNDWGGKLSQPGLHQLKKLFEVGTREGAR